MGEREAESVQEADQSLFKGIPAPEDYGMGDMKGDQTWDFSADRRISAH